ncbi:TPR-like protein [Auriscalpium vulgare]|uniref:TPR-like protein n=1 Tax=Auriscalpium vulgare TaxID=40419 RepID=A0ACB8R2D4_9AGAM|nr:TPR-like protein [Auriscalpium vulgare]
MFRKIGSVSSEATALQLLGKTYLAEKKYSTAKDHLSQALTIRRQENSLASHISNLTLLGEVHLYLKESEISLEFYKQALNFYEIKRDRVRQGQVLVGIGRVFAQQGRYHEAINYVKRAKELHEACKGAEHEVGNDLDELGKIYHAQHDIKFAEESWRDAVEIHRMQSDTAALTQSLLSLGGLYVNEGELDAAKTHYLESLMLCEKHHITHTQIKVLRCLGDMYRRGKDNDLAIKWYKKALEVLDRVDNFEEKEYVKDALAEVQEESGTTNTTVAKVLKDGPEVRTVGSSELPDIVSS